MTSKAPSAAPILPSGPQSRMSSYLWKLLAPRYLMGGLMLLGFQVAMNRIDWLSKQAIDTIFGRIPEQPPLGDAMRPALLMLVLP
jgi:hypothetical protein